MAKETLVNKQAGRQEELRKKMKDTIERYESVFSKPLSVAYLREFLAEESKQEGFRFLRDRLGFLSGTDIKYLRNIVDDRAKSPETPPSLDEDDVDDDGDTTGDKE